MIVRDERLIRELLFFLFLFLSLCDIDLNRWDRDIVSHCVNRRCLSRWIKQTFATSFERVGMEIFKFQRNEKYYSGGRSCGRRHLTFVNVFELVRLQIKLEIDLWRSQMTHTSLGSILLQDCPCYESKNLRFIPASGFLYFSALQFVRLPSGKVRRKIDRKNRKRR